MTHSIVFYEPGIFAGWPANNGIWTWDGGREAVVGFVTGAFAERAGHNVVPPYTHRFARTRNGGETWAIETPTTFPAEGATARLLPEPLNFGEENLILRVIGTGYHGSDEERGAFAVSRDRGATWEGPYRLGDESGDLCDRPPLVGWELTPRTDYKTIGESGCQLRLSGRPREGGLVDRAFTAVMREGGRKIGFLDWIVPPSDPYRAVMPSTVSLGGPIQITAVRRRRPDADECWIDCYISRDSGQTWAFQSKIADTGDSNGNPPALLLNPHDYRLFCAYGDRTERKMLGRHSADGGKSWLPPLVLRDDYEPDAYGDSDFGYPVAFPRPDGKIVVLYYWSTATHREHHIAATTLGQ